jgi:predicted nucleotidyltransferase
MRPSIALDQKCSAVREAALRFRTANPRIFGSVLHGTDQDGSDLDLLVDALPGATLFDLGGLQVEGLKTFHSQYYRTFVQQEAAIAAVLFISHLKEGAFRTTG